MRFFKRIIKFIEGILLLLVPIVIFYWFLSIIDLGFLKPFVAIMDMAFKPGTDFIKLFINLRLPYEDTVIDFSALIFALAIFGGSLVMSAIENMLNFIEEKLKEGAKKAKEAEAKRQMEIARREYLEVLGKNKIIYVVAKFTKKESSSAYLSNNDENPLPEDHLEDTIKNLVNLVEKFKGKSCESPKDEGIYNFIFYNIIDAIDFSFYVHNKAVAVTKEYSKQGLKLDSVIGCHCSFSEETASADFVITLKIMGLGGENQIIVSELFKHKYEVMKEESNIKFESKGIYSLEEKQFEVFEMKV